MSVRSDLDEPLTQTPAQSSMVGLNPYIRLETRGRKSNLPHIVELRYVWLGGRYYVLAGSAKSDWVMNALRQDLSRVRLREYLINVYASRADDGMKSKAIVAFESKYGAREVRRWYSNVGECLQLTPVGPAVKRGEASGEQEAKTDYAHWVSKRQDYRSEVASAFDSASEEYDFTIRRNFINTWIRKRSLQVLRKLVRPDDLLLEVGCGTGAEAMEVSSWVSGIVATDISIRMTDLVRAKAEARGIGSKVVPVTVSAAEIARVRETIGDRKLRVAYSFNGALNCEPDLGDFVCQLHLLLEPEGYFVCSVRNTTCASEMISHGLVLQFAKATPRRVQPTMVSVGGVDIPSTYFSPSEFVRRFEPYFHPVEIIGLPALLPPAYLNDYYMKLRGVFPLLERLEPALSGMAPFNRLGDQTLFVFRQTPP